MSYDLYFAPAGADRPVGLDFFRERPHYTVGNGQALYEHPDTGVHFIFEEVSDGDDPELPPATLVLLLNLFRPRCFAVEAATEIEALIEATGALVFDLQVDDPQPAAFSSAAFLESWNRSNRAAVSAVLSSGEDIGPLRTHPSEKLQALWAWNHRRASWNDELGDAVFVPAIGFFEVGDSTYSAVIWPDAVPVLLPQVDVVVVGLAALRRRRFWPFGGPTIATVRWDDLIDRLPSRTLREGPVPYLDLSTLEPSEALIAYLQKLPAASPKTLRRVAQSAVLDADLVPEVTERKR